MHVFPGYTLASIAELTLHQFAALIEEANNILKEKAKALSL